MKYLKQVSIILFITFLGELLHVLLPLPIPASVYGLVLMLAALCSGLVKVDHVKDTAVFLIEIMPVMFIPAGVGLLNAWSALKPIWVQICITTVLTTVIVMAATGLVTQAILRWEKKKEGKRESQC